MPDKFYTVREAAEVFKVSEDTIRRWIKDKSLPAENIGKVRPWYRIPCDAVKSTQVRRPVKKYF